MKTEQVIHALHRIGAIQMGSFEIKKDFYSPFKVDLERVISRPEVAREICELIFSKMQNFSHDLICGVPVFGSCFATYIAWSKDVPQVIRRKDKRFNVEILGSYKGGQKALVIQGLNVSGNSALETIEALEGEGLAAKDVICLLDLELGGKKKIKGRGYVLHPILTISEVLQTLADEGKIPGDAYKLATDFIAEQHG